MDDDLQNPPGEIVRLLRYAQSSGCDVVYTCYSRKHHASWRNLGSRFTNRVADWMLDKPQGALSFELPLHERLRRQSGDGL